MIHRNKNIRSCSYVQGAIQVETSTFQMEHEGAFYRLGAYTVRIHPDGSIHVFQLEPQHPKGQIHPHVNQFGIPCLGNITREVMERCISQDIAGAINLLVNFLLEGYDPGVAQAKITEWPRVEVTV